MSFQALKLAIASPADTAAEQSVLLVLAFHAGRDQIAGAYVCWPSVETIGREAGLKHPATARRVLRRLEEAGRIVRVPSPGRRTNRYLIPARIVRDPAMEGSDATLHAESRQPSTADVAELTVNDVCKSSSDLDTRAREAQRDALLQLVDEAMANGVEPWTT